MISSSTAVATSAIPRMSTALARNSFDDHRQLCKRHSLVPQTSSEFTYLAFITLTACLLTAAVAGLYRDSGIQMASTQGCTVENSRRYARSSDSEVLDENI